MEKDSSINADIEIIKEKTDNAGFPPLPESLSETRVADRIKKTRRKNRGRTVRFIAGGVAACLVIAAGAVGIKGLKAEKPVSGKADVTTAVIADGTYSAHYASSYEEIYAALKKGAEKQRIGGYYLYDGNMAKDERFMDSESVMPESAEKYEYTSESSADYAGTNLRTAGVDEADCIKTDGRYLYVGSYDSVIILMPEEDGSLTRIASVRLRDDYMTDGTGWIYTDGIFLSGGYLIVNITSSSLVTNENGYDEYAIRSGSLIYDVSDAASPVLVRTLMTDGDFVSSRITGGKLIMITEKITEKTGFSLSDGMKNAVPAVYYDNSDGEIMPAGSIVLCSDSADGFIIVTVLSLDDVSGKPAAVAVAGGGYDTYCTGDTLYVSGTDYGDYYGYYVNHGYDVNEDEDFAFAAETPFVYTEKTRIYSFDISGDAPLFRAEGCFEGSMLDSYSADEYGGYLRVAATRSAADGTENLIYVFDENLDVVSSLGGIAPGEYIYAARFMGQYAYLVTFYQTDPLFVVNLTDPLGPFVEGELKLPGFSSYLHPAGEGLMLGVGTSGDENGATGMAKLSLFDVSDPAHPVETDSYIREDMSWFNSDPKAFVTVSSDGSFLIPLTEEYAGESDNGEDWNYYFTRSSGCIRVSVTGDKKLDVTGEYLSEDDTWGRDRVTYIGGVVYSLDHYGSPVQIISFDIETGSELARQSF